METFSSFIILSRFLQQKLSRGKVLLALTIFAQSS